MAEQLARILEDRFELPRERMLVILRRTLIVMAGMTFVTFATLIVAFDSIFVRFSRTVSIEMGATAVDDIFAENNVDYFSEVLTREARETARDSVAVVYDAPNSNIARQQTQLAQQILDYIDNVRADDYGTEEQHIRDLASIDALELSDESLQTILQLDDERWSSIKDEILTVLSRMMRFEIILGQEQSILNQLDNQVNTRFNLRESPVIVDIVADLILPNTFENTEATEAAREAEANRVEPQRVNFRVGQLVVQRGEVIDESLYEALGELNMLRTDESVFPNIVRAGIASIITMVLIGLYLARFNRSLLYNETRRLSLIAVIFLIMLAMARFLGVEGNLYLFPASALALVYVTLVGPHTAIIGILGLALLTGVMDDSLQTMALISTAGIIGTLALQRAERLNQFVIAGILIAINNVLVVVTFNSNMMTTNQIGLLQMVLLAGIGGLVIVPATAFVTIYVVTALFNLPTTLKLIDLRQPNKPLLQRLLREAPGSYQHSLQVGNLAEQAANAIGADAQLTYVAALYHDIGKMLNPLYFTENQQDISNPHNVLDDPYRSAEIIISHVTDGDDLARQYRLPQRIRDFIREHHGTTQVYFFYQKALKAVDGDTSAVTITDFTYPGPRPRSRETAILMMADSCEAAVRSVKPKSKQEINDLVAKIIDDKRASGQLDDSGLTLNEIRKIRESFIEILNGMFHPRINYEEELNKKPSEPKPAPAPKPAPKIVTPPSVSIDKPPEKPIDTAPATPDMVEAVPPDVLEKPPTTAKKTDEEPIPEPVIYEEDEPMTEVPRLPTLDERKETGSHEASNGKDKPQDDVDTVEEKQD